MDFKNLLVALIIGLLSIDAQAQYENIRKGSIIDIGNVKAIVFKLDDEGHGTAMTIKAIRGVKRAWGTNTKLLANVDMSSESDGHANTKVLYDFLLESGLDLSTCPVMNWCNSLGEGWYIPASEQIEEFVNFFLGNDQTYSWDDEEFEDEKLSQEQINERLVDNGGYPFLSTSMKGLSGAFGVYTSTKRDNGKVVVYQYDFEDNSWKFTEYSILRLNEFTMGRAFYDF